MDKQELLSSICIKTRYSINSIERMLDLDPNTFSSQDPALIPLLKIINQFPWMLQVAEKEFRPQQARKYLMYAAIEESLKESKITKASDQRFKRLQPRHKRLIKKIDDLCKNTPNNIP